MAFDPRFVTTLDRTAGSSSPASLLYDFDGGVGDDGGRLRNATTNNIVWPFKTVMLEASRTEGTSRGVEAFSVNRVLWPLKSYGKASLRLRADDLGDAPVVLFEIATSKDNVFYLEFAIYGTENQTVGGARLHFDDVLVELK